MQKNTGRTHFKKGYTPWNKGLKGYHAGNKYRVGTIPWNKGKKGLQVAWNKGLGKPKIKKIKVKKTIEELLARKRFRNQRYKANKRRAIGSHTFNEWIVLKYSFKNLCLCCKRQEPKIKLTEDHIIPLSMSGTDYIDNIQPLCIECNTRKHARYIDYRNSSNFNYQFMN
uniref:Putative homing endonuclease n=1 Tax=viral metagenome TaxID=1070528 RepID=A0A6M3IGM3_9ZZZZ